ncbi:hypothetical protein Bbelb_038280 [Branchiostoma belcheri]|nr:hypothetical protein Bbelb_038280 [Branchiostoma belcheri]
MPKSYGYIDRTLRDITIWDVNNYSRIRLAEGSGPNEGRVEVRPADSPRWGTVCHKGFDLKDAEVVCRMLGYPNVYGVRPGAYFGKGMGPIYMEDLQCDGTESSLFNCSHKGWRVHNCWHGDDVGVVCGFARALLTSCRCTAHPHSHYYWHTRESALETLSRRQESRSDALLNFYLRIVLNRQQQQNGFTVRNQHSSPTVEYSITRSTSPTAGSLSSPSNNMATLGTGHSTDSSSDSVTAGFLPAKSQNWRTLVINADGISSKVAPFANLVSYTKPDATPMCETKLGQHHFSAEFMPPGYSTPVRRDRASGAGGVLIAVRDCYTATEVISPSEGNTEIAWIKVFLRNQKTLYLGSYYRSPSGKHSEQLDELEKSLTHIRSLTKNNPESTIILGGDFNLGDIDSIPTNSRKRVPSERLTRSHRRQSSVKQKSSNSCGQHRECYYRRPDTRADTFLVATCPEMQREPTRFGRILDLFVTSKPSLVKTPTTLPGIAYDHGVIVADCDTEGSTKDLHLLKSYLGRE